MELKAGPTVLVVPMTGDPALAIPDLTVVLQASPSNGCKKVSYLLPQSLTCVAKTRITAATNSQITPAELQQLLRNDWTGGISARRSRRLCCLRQRCAGGRHRARGCRRH